MSLLDKATIITTPTAHSNGTLHSIKGGSVADFDVVRGSAATRVNAEGLIEDIATNIPRIDYTDGTASILLEPQSTNLVTYSEDFSDAAWGSGGVGTSPTLSSGFLAPDGTNTAFKISNPNKNSFWSINNPSLTQNGARSIYARTTSGSGTISLLSKNDNTNNTFTLTEQWQRFDLNETLNAISFFYAVDFRGVGNTLDELIIWGAQAEALPYATSYIPTSGAIATRLGDAVTGAGDATTFNDSEGVLYFEGSTLVGGSNTQISISDGTTDNGVQLRFDSTPDRLTIFLRGNSGTFAIKTISGVTQTDNNKIALVWDITNFRIWLNGVEVGTIATNDLPVGLDTLNLANNTGTANLIGKVKSVITFDTVLTDEELICLTTI